MLAAFMSKKDEGFSFQLVTSLLLLQESLEQFRRYWGLFVLQ